MNDPVSIPRAGAANAHEGETEHARSGSLLRDLMLGFNDGLVASFAVTSGVAGAFSNRLVVVMAGLAEMLGGAISMGLAAFISERSAAEFYHNQLRREQEEVERWPELEREEIRVIYRAKGFSGALLDAIVNHITSDPERWCRVMMLEELGLPRPVPGGPLRSGSTVGVSYLAGALVPVLPYLLLDPGPGVALSAVCAALALFTVGAAKTRLTARKWWQSGLETMATGVAAAAVTYAAGWLFSRR